MKKWLKFWLATLAVLWIMWISLYTSNSAEAAKTWSSTLKLTLSSAWDSTCAISAWWTWSETASASQQANKASTTTPILTCTFNNAEAETLKLAGTAMAWTAWSTAIPVWNVTTVNSCSVSSTLWGTCGSTWSTALTTAWVSLYSKSANKIGTWTFTETLKLTIPAWQIPGTYTGTLSFTIS